MFECGKITFEPVCECTTLPLFNCGKNTFESGKISFKYKFEYGNTFEKITKGSDDPNVEIQENSEEIR